MLAKIQERAGSLDQAMRTLSDAKDIRARLLKRVQVEQPDAVEEQVKQNMPEYNLMIYYHNITQ